MKLLFILIICGFLWPPHLWAGPRRAGNLEAADRQFVVQLFQHEEFDFAKEEIRTYQQTYPKGVFLDEMLYLSGRIAEQKKQYTQAQQRYQTLQKSFPNSPYQAESSYHQGLVSLGLNQTRLGIKQLKKFQTKHPKSRLEVWAPLGRAYFQTQQYPLAVKALQQAKQQHPDQLEVAWDLAWARYFSGQKERAHQDFLQLLDRDLNNSKKAKLLFQLASDQFKNQHYPKAYRGFKQQWSLYPTASLDLKSKFWSAESVVMWGRKAGVGRLKEALWLLEQNQQSTTPIHPVRSLRHQAMLQESLGNLQVALDLYQQLVTADPDLLAEVPLSLKRAGLAQKLSQPGLAQQILRQGIKQQPERRLETALWSLLLQQKDCPQILLRAQAQPIRVQAGWYSLGACQAKAGLLKPALEAWKHLSPSGPWEAQAALAELAALARLGREKRALQLSERGIKAGWEPQLPFLQAKLQSLSHLAPKKAVIWGEAQLTEKPYLLDQVNFLLALATAYGTEPKSPKRALELYRLAQAQIKQPERAKAVLEKRRQLLVHFKDNRALLGLYREALAMETHPEAKLNLRLEIVKLQFALGRAVPESELSLLGQESGPVGAGAWGLLAEKQIALKHYKKAALFLTQGLKKNLPPQLELRLTYRLAQVYQAHQAWNQALKTYQKVAVLPNPYQRQAKKQIQAIQAYRRMR